MGFPVKWRPVCCVILAERGVVQLRLSNCAVSDKADIKRLYLDFGEKQRSKVSVGSMLDVSSDFLTSLPTSQAKR